MSATSRPGAPTAVVAPLPEELDGVLERVEVEERGRAGGVRFVRGRLAGVPVVVAATGDGQRAAERGLAALLAAEQVSRVLALGVAGGLGHGLAAGDLVVSERVLEAVGSRLSEAPAPDADWRRRLLAGWGGSSLQPLDGTLVSAERVLADPGSKLALGRLVSALGGPGRTDRAVVSEELGGKVVGEAVGAPGAFGPVGLPPPGDEPPAVVDLETATYARIAAARGLPFLAIRAVLDPLGQPLPLDFSRLTRADGRVSRLRVALAALRRPSVVPALLDLRRATRLCAGRLAAAAELAVTV